MRGVRALDQDPVAFARVASHPIPRRRAAGDELSACGFGQHPGALTVEHAHSVENLRGAAADATVRLLGKGPELSHLASTASRRPRRGLSASASNAASIDSGLALYASSTIE